MATTSRLSLAISFLSLASSVRAEGTWSFANDPPLGGYYAAIITGRLTNGDTMQACRSEDDGTGTQVPGRNVAGGTDCEFIVANRVIENIAHERLTPTWVRSSPQGGSVFGVDPVTNRSVAACRALHEAGVHIGKKLHFDDACLVPYGGQELRLTKYEELSRVNSFSFREVSGTPLPYDAIAGGVEADGTYLYLCLAEFQGGTHVGKTRRDWNACAIGWGGGEHWVSSFRVLVPLFLETTSNLFEYPILVAGRAPNGARLGICKAPVRSGIVGGSFSFEDGTCTVIDGGIPTELSSGFQTLRGQPPPF